MPPTPRCRPRGCPLLSSLLPLWRVPGGPGGMQDRTDGPREHSALRERSAEGLGFFFNNFSLKYHVQTEKCPYPTCMAESTFTSCVLSLAPDQENGRSLPAPGKPPGPTPKAIAPWSDWLRRPPLCRGGPSARSCGVRGGSALRLPSVPRQTGRVSSPCSTAAGSPQVTVLRTGALHMVVQGFGEPEVPVGVDLWFELATDASEGPMGALRTLPWKC